MRSKLAVVFALAIRGIDYLVRIVVPWATPGERTFTLRTSRAVE